MVLNLPTSMVRILLFWFGLLPATPATVQLVSNVDRQELSWNEFYKLRWDDFQGKPDENSESDAGTAIAIRAKPFLVNKKVKYDVVAIFNRSKSWVRDRSPSLLAHEQLHFDIAELYARKIRKKVKELNAQGVNDIDTYNKAIRELLTESNKADEQYDLETLHGALGRKQAAWADKVERELTSLTVHRKTKQVIGSPSGRQ